MLLKKFENLKKEIEKLGSVVIAFSGGVDSTFIAKVCLDVLGKDNVLAVTATSRTYPEFEFIQAKKLAEEMELPWMWIKSEELDIKDFRENPPDRCYYCKKELFTRLKDIAFRKGYNFVIDGTNYDDTDDFRPGIKAADKIGVISPLKIAKITKNEIRELSKILGLPTWNKPSFACLASRFPYGETITEEKLIQVDKAENFLRRYNLKQIRVRYHKNIARIEVEASDFQKIIENREEIIENFKKFGFTYITLDLEAYRTGSMNYNFNHNGG